MPDIPKAFQSLIETSITAKSATHTDALGLPYPYPKVVLKTSQPPEFEVTSVVVRSVIQYMLEGSGYIVEIAIYREWTGRNTSLEPELKASVSMFHQEWNWQMRGAV